MAENFEEIVRKTKEAQEERVKKILVERLKEANNLLDQALLKLNMVKECLSYLKVQAERKEDGKDG